MSKSKTIMKNAFQRNLSLDTSDVCDVCIHPKQDYAAFVCSRGSVIISKLTTGERTNLPCPCGEDDIGFRSFKWDQSAGKDELEVRGVGISCDSHGVRLFDFTTRGAATTCSVSTDISSIMHSVDCFNCCLQLLSINGPTIKLLAGNFFRRLQLRRDSAVVRLEQDLDLSKFFHDSEDDTVSVRQAYVIEGRTAVAGQSAFATWLSNDMLYFWNLDVTERSEFIIAVVNLRSFLPSRIPCGDIASVAISGDGIILCAASSDGLVSVIDRNVFLQENPQMRSSAFRFSVGYDRSPSGCSSPTFSIASTSNQQVTPGRATPADQSDVFSRNHGEPRSRPSSTHPFNRSSSYSVTSVGRPSRSLFHQNESLFSSYVDRSATATPELKSLSRSSSRSSLASETLMASDMTALASRRSSLLVSDSSFAPYQAAEKPASIVGSVLSMFSGAGQGAGASSAMVHAQTMPQLRDQSGLSTSSGCMEAACCWFHIPKWEVSSQFRQITFVGSVLYIWLQQSLSMGGSVGNTQETIIALKLSSYEIFSFSCKKKCIPLFFKNKKPQLFISFELHPFKLPKLLVDLNKLDTSEMADVGAALCCLDDWQRSSVPLKTFETALTQCRLDSVKLYLDSTKSAFSLKSTDETPTAVSPSQHSIERRNVYSPAPASAGFQWYNYNEVDRFDAALHAVERYLTIDVSRSETLHIDRLLGCVYEYCSRAVAQLCDNLVMCTSSETMDLSYRLDSLNETKHLLALVVDSSWRLQKARESMLVSPPEDLRHKRDAKDRNFEQLRRLGFDAALLCIEQGYLELASILLQQMDFDVAAIKTQICLNTFNRNLSYVLSEDILTVDERLTFNFIKLLDEVYPYHDFEAVKASREQAKTDKSAWNSCVDLRHVMDDNSFDCRKHCKAICPDLGNTPTPCDLQSCVSPMYAEVLPLWVMQWTPRQRSMVLIEALINQKSIGEDFMNVYGIEAADMWNYYCLHLEVDLLMAWIDVQFPLQKAVNATRSKWPTTESINQEMVDELRACPTWIANRLLDRLALSGVFSTAEGLDAGQLVARLSRISSVLRKPNINVGCSKVLSNDQLHRYVIESCCVNRLPQLLFEYLDSNRLNLNGEELSAMNLKLTALPSWLHMMIAFRQASKPEADNQAMYDALCAASNFVLNKTTSVLQLLTEPHHVLWAISALVYCPDMLDQIVQSRNSNVEAMVSRYPRLFTALFQSVKPVPDVVSLYDLLQTETLCDVTQLFRWRNSSENKVNGSGGMPNFTDLSLTSQYGSVEQLDFTYYLRLGRPSYAFYAFVISLCHLNNARISSKSVNNACRVARCVAIENYQSVEIVAACVAFVSMLGHRAFDVQLYVTVANQISNENKLLSSSDISQLVYGCSRDDRGVIIKVEQELTVRTLRQLKESELSRLDQGHHWLTLILFNRQHGLTDPTHFYVDCAQTNDWMPFLLWAEIFQCPPLQLLQVTHTFQSSAIRDHVENAISRVYVAQSKSLSESNADGNAAASLLHRLTYRPKPNLVELLLKCDSRLNWLSVLSVAHDARCQMLCILAACHPGRNLAVCLRSWFIAVAPLTFSADTDSFLDIIHSLILNNCADILLAGLRIFAPDCVMIEFIEFYCQFVDCGRVSVQHLHNFMSKVSQFYSNADSSIKFTMDSVADIVLLLVERALTLSNPYAIGQLLVAFADENVPELLSKSSLNDSLDISLLIRLHKVVAKTVVRLNYVVLGRPRDTDVYRAEIEKVLDVLKTGHQFNTARELVKVAGLSDENVTTDELRYFMNQLKMSQSWHVQENRVEFWKMCQKTMMKNGVPSSVAANFLQSHSSDTQTSNEQAVLLQLAYECLDKHYDETAQQNIFVELWLCRIRQHMSKDSEEPVIPKQFNRHGLLLPKPKQRRNSSVRKPVQLNSLAPAEELCLEELLDALVNAGRLIEAEHVMAVFGRPYTPICIITAAVRLLLDQIKPSNLPEDIRQLSSVTGRHKHVSVHSQSAFTLPLISNVIGSPSRSSPERSIDSSSDSSSAAAMRLLSHCRNGAVCCQYVTSLAEIAEVTGLSFSETLNTEEFDLLRRILSSSSSNRFHLAKDLITIVRVSDSQLAPFVGDLMLESLQLHEDIDISVAETTKKAVLSLPRNLCSVESRSSSGSVALIQLFENPEPLGNCLVELVRSIDHAMNNSSVKLLTVQAVLLTYANDCFVIAASTTGLANILAVVKKVVLRAFEMDQYDIAVHLLTSIGRYSDMNYVFDGLKQVGMLNKLFTATLRSEDRLRLALIDYIQRFHSDDTVTLAQIASHFGMHQELATYTEQLASAKLEKLGASRLSTKAAIQTLRSALDEYVEAAGLYMKAKCSNELASCMTKIRLLVLQTQLLKSTSQRIINLRSDDEAINVIKSCEKFSDAYVVYDCYRAAYDFPNFWPDVVFEKAIKNDQLDFVTEMAAAKMLSSEVIKAVAERFLQHADCVRLTAKQIDNMKFVLSFCANMNDKFRIAKKCQFDDVVRRIRSDDYLEACLTE